MNIFAKDALNFIYFPYTPNLFIFKLEIDFNFPLGYSCEGISISQDTCT